MLIISEEACLPMDGEMERLRSRLNHDLIKNRLLLALMRLRAIAAGQVSAEDGGRELRSEIGAAWGVVKEDAARLGQIYVGPGIIAKVFALPFIRQLDEDDRRTVAEAIAEAPGLLESNSEDLVALQNAITDANELVSAVSAGSYAPMSSELNSIESAIDAVSRVAGCLSALRRQ